MSEFTNICSSQENRTQRRWPTQSNMASLNHARQQNTSGWSLPSIAGNATNRPDAEISSSTRSWKPDVGLKQGRKTIKSKAKEGLEGLKTGRIAQKLGEIAVANDLAYVPRMPDDAVIGINEDEKHSRESYVQVHHSAIDFTRQLPKGTQPGYYNPETHTVVARQDDSRPHTMHPLQAEQLQEPLLDLLDMELIANKPRTMPDMMPSITVSKVEDVNDARTDLQPLRQRTNPSPAPQYPERWQVPLTSDQPTTRKPQTNTRPTNSSQKPLAQVPLPTRPAERPSTRTPSRPQANTRHDDGSELFLSPPPTLQDHPTFDVLQPNPHPPVLQPIQTNFPRSNTTNRPTLSAHPTNPQKSQPARAPHHHHPRPPATWAAPAPSQPQSPLPIYPHKPATIIPLPFDPEPGPKTPPLSLEDVNTFSPKTDYIVQEFVSSVSLSRSDSEQRRKRSKSVRRGTVVHRQKTSQEIWDDKFAVEAESARERERKVERKLEQEKQIRQERSSERVSEEVDIEPEATKQQRQAREKANFERRHQERVLAMQAEIEQDERRVRESKRQETAAARGLNFRPRPTAKTFEPDSAEHRLRTRTVTQTQTGNPLDGNKQEQEHRGRGLQLRPTARTFEMDRGEHSVRSEAGASASRTSQRSQQVYQQPLQATTQQQQPQSQQSQWQPNPTARTFETTDTGTGGVAANKGWSQGWNQGWNRWRRG